METLKLELPMLYGDHHVAEVHALLGGLPGVKKVYASSAWKLVQVEYDPDLIEPAALRQALSGRGYTSERAHLPLISARTRDLTDYAVGPGTTEQFVEHMPAWNAPGAPCPGFDMRQPGEVHPADQD